MVVIALCFLLFTSNTVLQIYLSLQVILSSGLKHAMYLDIVVVGLVTKRIDVNLTRFDDENILIVFIQVGWEILLFLRKIIIYLENIIHNNLSITKLVIWYCVEV